MPRVQFQDRSGFQLLDPGNYLVRVNEAQEGQSQNGNAKIDLKLEVIPLGVTIYDTLVFTEAAAWKIDTFLKATGMAPEKGQFVDLTAEQCLNAVGRVRVGKKPGLKDPSKVYNSVEAWLSDKESLAIADKARDDIPF